MLSKAVDLVGRIDLITRSKNFEVLQSRLHTRLSVGPPKGVVYPFGDEADTSPVCIGFFLLQKADCTLKSESADEDEDTSAGAK